eukprot:6436402-Prymnesium_polylepis.1
MRRASARASSAARSGNSVFLPRGRRFSAGLGPGAAMRAQVPTVQPPTSARNSISSMVCGPLTPSSVY